MHKTCIFDCFFNRITRRSHIWRIHILRKVIKFNFQGFLLFEESWLFERITVQWAMGIFLTASGVLLDDVELRVWIFNLRPEQRSRGEAFNGAEFGFAEASDVDGVAAVAEG